MSMRRRIKGLSAEQIKQLSSNELDTPLLKEDFEIALSKISPSVSKADIDKFEKWMKEFGSA